jgi:hypothetical protein
MMDGKNHGYTKVLYTKYALGNTLVIVHDIVLPLMPVLPEKVISAHAKGMRLSKKSTALTQPLYEVRPGVQPGRINGKAAVFWKSV